MRTAKGTLPIILLCCFTACKTFSKTQFGEVIGQKTGTALGSVVGDAAGNEVAGTMIGGSLGAATGEAMVKSSLEKQAEEILANVNDATVRRFAETLVVEFRSNSLFLKNNSTTLSEKAKVNLAKFTTILNKYPASRIAISVFDRNKREASQSLSEKRAAMVADYFRLKGISSSRIKLGGSEFKSKGSTVSVLLS